MDSLRIVFAADPRHVLRQHQELPKHSRRGNRGRHLKAVLKDDSPSLERLAEAVVTENGRRICQRFAGRREIVKGIGAAVVTVVAANREDARPSEAATHEEMPDASVTDRVFLDISECPSMFVTSREVDGAERVNSQAGPVTVQGGGSSFRCDDGVPIGRIVLGLYGSQVPETVKNFKAMCDGSAGSSYKGTLIHRVIAGQYMMAGKQGYSREKGEVLPPANLETNYETLSHRRPGTVSLSLSENDDDDYVKLRTDYHNVEFLITTGPGPAIQLDNKNIVFGRVLEGMDVVRAVAAVAVYKPNQSIRQFNELASLLGDQRASNARNFWYRPLKALYISDCGVFA